MILLPSFSLFWNIVGAVLPSHTVPCGIERGKSHFDNEFFVGRHETSL
jgi:hypothetical protein